MMATLMGTPAPRSLAGKVEWLFQNHTRPDGSPYSLREVEEGAAQLGHRISAASLRKIRQGQTRNPGYRAVVVLARFFGVSVTWLMEDAGGVEDACSPLPPSADVALLSATPEVTEIARRVSCFDTEVQRAVLALVDCL